jgi:hydrogenase small subunit
MPGFPENFMPFLDEPAGSLLSTTAITMYGLAVRALRGITRGSMNEEPDWRRPRQEAGSRSQQ